MKMSNDIYQQQSFWTSPDICIEKDKNGKCLVSAKYVYLDMGKTKDLFCEQVKNKKNDKTV